MICSYCDSRVSPVPDNGVCPHCGGVLDKPKFPDPPIGKYKDAAGYIEIGEKSVTFCRKHFFKAHKKTVPYSEIYAVAYQPGKPFDSGYLCIRQWQDRHLPMPAGARDVIWDPTGVYFTQHRNAQFHKVYMFLRQCADIACRANASWQRDENTLCGRYPVFYGYMEFGPKSLTVHKESKLLPKTERTIAYDEIAQVAFLEGKGSQRGGLSIRVRNENKDLDRALRNAVIDDASIDFLAFFNDKMREIYQQLTAHAEQNKIRWAQENSKDPQDSVSVELPAFPECLKPLQEGSEEQELAEKRRALRASGQVYCPHCLSTSFTVDKQQPSMRYIPFRSPLAALFRLMRELLFLSSHAINGDMCVCLRCGGTWFSKRWELGERHVELVSRYLGAYPQLELAGADGASLLLTRSQVSLQFPEKKGCVIPFRSLVHADLRKSNGLPYGQLTLRIKANKMRPLPRSVDDARKENYSIVYTEELQESFTQVYAVLMAIIEENKKSGSDPAKIKQNSTHR